MYRGRRSPADLRVEAQVLAGGVGANQGGLYIFRRIAGQNDLAEVEAAHPGTSKTAGTACLSYRSYQGGALGYGDWIVGIEDRFSYGSLDWLTDVGRGGVQPIRQIGLKNPGRRPFEC